MNLPQTPSFALKGKRALITGAGRGIGLAASAALASAGADVTLVARSEGEIRELASAINAEGADSQSGKAEYACLDVGDLAAVESFFGERPAFDIVLNNAGTNRPKSIFDVEVDDYDAVLDLNLKSTVFVTRAAAKRMIDEGIEGSIIHMSSQMGHVGGPGRTLYCASKWGLEGFNKALALDLAPHKIRTNTICPTFIETPMTRPFFEDANFKESVLNKIKLGRIGQVEDLMGPVVFLASEASALMTGSSLLVDGGWTAD